MQRLHREQPEVGRGCRGNRGAWSPTQLPGATLPPACPQVRHLERRPRLRGRESPPCVSPTPCSPRFLKMEEFFPETYRLDIKEEREAFFTLFDGETLLDPLGREAFRAGPRLGRG